MSEISSLYSSKASIYRKNGGRRSEKSKHGNVKHIVFKDGSPQYTEIIQVSKECEEESPSQSGEGKQRRRIKAGGASGTARRPSEEVLKSKKEKLNTRLKNAIRESQTLWSQKEGIWISYQGSNSFLVKLFNSNNRLLSSEMMSQNEIVESSIPGILEASWVKV